MSVEVTSRTKFDQGDADTLAAAITALEEFSGKLWQSGNHKRSLDLGGLVSSVAVLRSKVVNAARPTTGEPEGGEG